MLSWKDEFKDLRSASENAIDKIQKTVSNSKIPVAENNRTLYAWGQYLDAPKDSAQKGIYGTSAALQILSLNDNSRHNYSDIIDKGVKWLLDEFETEGSRTKDKLDGNVIYKYCAFISGISVENTFSQDYDKYFMTLAKRICNWGWGEYYYDDGEKDQPKALSTAMTLLALHNYPNCMRKDDWEKSLEELAKIVKGNASNYVSHKDESLQNKEAILTELGLCLLAMRRYRIQKKGAICANLITFEKELLVILEKIIHREEIDLNSWYIHLFVVSEPSKIAYRNRYIFFEINPIIALTLMECGRTGQNLDYILKVIEHYTSNITNSDAYASRVTGHKATGDQLLIVQCLQRFADMQTNEINTFVVMWNEFKRIIRTGVFSIVLFLGLAGLSAYAFSNPSDIIKIAGTILSAASSAVLTSLVIRLRRGKRVIL